MGSVFNPDELEAMARETGFYIRKSKVNPSVFFDLLMYDMSSGASKSLSQLSIEARSEHDIGVTKQGIDKKFNEHTLSFLKKLIETQLSVELDLNIDAGWLRSFNRVPIKDGTRFSLPEEYKDYLPGSGGSGSKAGACIQFEFDLKPDVLLRLILQHPKYLRKLCRARWKHAPNSGFRFHKPSTSAEYAAKAQNISIGATLSGSTSSTLHECRQSF